MTIKPVPSQIYISEHVKNRSVLLSISLLSNARSFSFFYLFNQLFGFLSIFHCEKLIFFPRGFCNFPPDGVRFFGIFLPSEVLKLVRFLNKENVIELGNGGKVTKKQLAIVGISILLICVGLSGCEESVDDTSKFIGKWTLVDSSWTFDMSPYLTQYI